jgi:acetyl esterase/lipase
MNRASPVESAVPEHAPSELVAYKKPSVGAPLRLHLFRPPDGTANGGAIVFFHGGGWIGGSVLQFYPHCDHFARRGLLAISVEYRTRESHGTPATACAQDGRSAMRWIRANASRLDVDADRIVAGGGSAGGQVAAMTSMGGSEADEPADDTTIPTVAAALVLFNPVLLVGQDAPGDLEDRFGQASRLFSPLQQLIRRPPPSALFSGTADVTTPIATAERYQRRCRDLGGRCDLNRYDGRHHAFFNYGKPDFATTLVEADDFLASLGFVARTSRAARKA